MEQVFESQNFLLKVDESCQSACLQVKNLDEFKDFGVAGESVAVLFV